jgi:uncharacterized secreted protein with C-terminal beta-propeller domain
MGYVLLGVICGSLIGGAALSFDLDYTAFKPSESNFGSLERFRSSSELKAFLEKQSSPPVYFEIGGIWRGSQAVTMAADAAKSAASGANLDYSGTNVQVAGVDEADSVKTDGKYIYIARGKTVYILIAYPPEESKLISKIELTESVGDIYIAGDKLVVFTMGSIIYAKIPASDSAIMPYPGTDSTNIKIFDVSDREKPKMEREFKAEGGYVASRMIGDFVYLIVQKGAYIIEGKVQPPIVQEGSTKHQVIPTEIYYYDNSTEPWYSYTMIVSINTQIPLLPVTSETFLLGASSTVYVSPEHLYLTVGKWSNTTIHKIKLDKGKITYVAEGSVPGWVLNQFSMDEDKGYFRIATTTSGGWFWRGGSNSQSSAVYVLDSSMKTVGKLEGLAPGESIYSARFMGDRCYLVTFKKVDPLFVIELKNPTQPKVLGKLKIPGYSNYLHPYDENHLIGLGKETAEAAEGNFAWYQGIKISLFDVTDISNPIELAKIEVVDRGTDSPALYDHRAFLFNREKGLLVIPILEAKINPSTYGGNPPANAYGDFVYQGAYVFNIGLNGIELKDRITHIKGDELMKSGYWFSSEYQVERSFYVEQALYTISGKLVKINDLKDLKELAAVPYS